MAGLLWGVGSAQAATELALAPAVECQERGGLPNVLAKLQAGAATRIAYLGGSITAQDGWRPKTLKWFRDQYPKANIQEITHFVFPPGLKLAAAERAKLEAAAKTCPVKQSLHPDVQTGCEFVYQDP